MNRTKLAAQRKKVDAQLHAVKVKIAKDIADILEQRQLTQTEAAYLMQDAPSQVSLVVTGKLRGFSTERLLRMRAMLGGLITVSAVHATNPTIAYTRRNLYSSDN